MYTVESLLFLIISFVSLASVLLSLLLFLVYRARKEQKQVHKEREKMEKIYQGLYHEYERIRGRDWAKNNLSEVIKNVVGTVGAGLTNVQPRTSRRISSA